MQIWIRSGRVLCRQWIWTWGSLVANRLNLGFRELRPVLASEYYHAESSLIVVGLTDFWTLALSNLWSAPGISALPASRLGLHSWAPPRPTRSEPTLLLGPSVISCPLQFGRCWFRLSCGSLGCMLDPHSLLELSDFVFGVSWFCVGRGGSFLVPGCSALK